MDAGYWRLEYSIVKGVFTINLELKKLHTVYKGSIAPGISLTCVKTDKFKTGCLSINLICKLSRDTAAGVALLPRVLRRGSSEFPDMESIAAALDELYGVRIEPIVRKKGELQCIGFYSDFPDDRYIPDGENVLEKTVSLVCGILLSPDMYGGFLRSDYIESEKKNLVDDIRAGINDKRGYSIDRLIGEMCAEEAFGVNKLGDEDSACAITPESLTNIYFDVLSNSMIEVLYCGSAEPESLVSMLRRAFRQALVMDPALCPTYRSVLSGLPERADISIPETQIVVYPDSDSPRRFTEELDVTQGKLVVGFRLGKAMNNTPDLPALMVFNAAYGSGDTSKLFLNVRERLSLCYYITSMLEKHKGIMLVASGVEAVNFETALDEIMAQLEQIKNGNVSDQELLSAKRAVVTAIKSAMDSPAGLIDIYFDSSISKAGYDPVELCEKVEAITLDRIVEVASEIRPDSIYLLSGSCIDD